MEPRLSQRVQRIKPSPTLAVTARAAELRAAGHDIIGLGAGEPDFDTPEHIKQAAKKALDDGLTKYTPVDGTPGLKDAVIHKFKGDNGLDYTREQILVSCGAKHSIYNLMQALLDAGDEVLIPAPYWVSYPDMTLLADAKPVIVDAGIERGFKITPEQLDAAITERTRLLILNSPSNPTGVSYSGDELAALGEVIVRHPRVMVASDDIYEHIRWEAGAFSNILTVCPELYERTVVLNGVSKAYAMTGWRIGYAAGPAWLIKAMKKIQSQSTSNPTSIAQAAAQEALDADQSFIQDMVTVFKERHDYVHGALNQLAGVECLPAQGAFYLFPSVKGALDKMTGVDDDVAMAERLLQDAGVALVPGSAFGAQAHMRLSFATSMENLQSAMERLAGALGRQ
ncbi:MAG: pyridoxal phosphate-dependent aminotransferase [Gammaproteobacteria bacterium]|nr:pyridoxal phosphate-dependent aminotransferase [Gammaproteobacteria bacterium]